MATILVMERPENWPLQIPGLDVVLARNYLTDPTWSSARGVKVFNVCRSYRYQSVGYYVSLLAEARGHKPLPSVTTIQDLVSDQFTLSIYFGENLAKRYHRISRQLFNLFPAPLLRAQFVRLENLWELKGIRPIGAREIPDSHRPFVIEQTQRYFNARSRTRPKITVPRYEMAILTDPEEPHAPSNERAIRRFEDAAEELGIRPDLITRDDLGQIQEYDALFIRATTAVNHFTYRFSRRAAAEGLVVIDDPDSILRCTNKVFLAELFARNKIPVPATIILHRDNLEQAIQLLGFPMILKLPDSSFSQGVVRVDDKTAFEAQARSYLGGSDLLIAQEFLPTDFDWRVGTLNGEPLFAARYHMAKGHWQIIRGDGGTETRYGGVEAVAPDEVPPDVLRTAVKAAGLVGQGLYGVDLKMKEDRVYVMEINDNPNVDAGYEDKIQGREIYQKIMSTFLNRLEARHRREGKE